MSAVPKSVPCRLDPYRIKLRVPLLLISHHSVQRERKMFDRITQALPVSSSERFSIIYGSGVEDVFINRDGTELNIEQAILTEFKAHGYKRIVFSAPHRPVFFLDERSETLTWPSATQSPSPGRRDEKADYTTRVGHGPFGPRMLKSDLPAPGTAAIPPLTVSHCGLPCQPLFPASTLRPLRRWT